MLGKAWLIRMSKVGRGISIVILVCMVLFCEIVAYTGVGSDITIQSTGGRLSNPDDTLRVWYADEEFSDYMASVSLAFYEETNIRVIPTLVSGLEYLEAIYDISLEEGNYPDLYIATNDVLEKAYLSGLATEIADVNNVVSLDGYPQTALNAVTYNDKLVAYPLSFETSIFLYNKTYLYDMARSVIMLAEYEEMLPEDPTAEFYVEEPSEEEIAAMAAELVPETLDDILMLANSYDAPSQVEAVLEWDVTDVFYNYFFVGSSINMGGQYGDDITQIELYNEDALVSLQLYQNMQQFFSIDADEVTYETVVQDFIDGKIVFAFVTTDAIEQIEDAKEDGIFVYEYEIGAIPNINEEIQAQSMSVTNAVVVNGFSTNQELANELAEFIAVTSSDSLYDMSGKIAAKSGISYENVQLLDTFIEYEASVPITKMMEASNFWVQLEICMNRVWSMEDVEEQLRILSETIMTQVTGETYIQEPIG